MAAPYRVVFGPEARNDLLGLYAYIAAHSGEERALAYVERIEQFCFGLAQFPERGARRDDLLPGLRVTGFEKRCAIAFHIGQSVVTIDRILYGGRDMDSLFDKT